MGRTFVGIQQDLPFIPLGAQHRLALVDGIFVSRLINMAIAITVFAPRGRDITLGDTLHHFLQKLILKRLLAGHDLAAIVVFLVQIVQHFWPGTRIVPQPVVVIDTRIAMRGDRIRSTSGFWRHGILTFSFYIL